MISKTPKPPYYAAIFSSQRFLDDQGYESMANKMFDLAEKQPGFLGVETVRSDGGFGITVSYWENLKIWTPGKRTLNTLRLKGLAKRNGTISTKLEFVRSSEITDLKRGYKRRKTST